jgi:RNA polymerase sigma-70 factor, ECF subfamily
MLKRQNSDYTTLTDGELASRIATRDVAAVRLVTGRNNQRLFRAAWSILKDRSEAEEAVQDGYMKAFDAIETFAGRSSLSTWLTRIVVNEALTRRRRAQRWSRLLNQEPVLVLDEYREKLMAGSVTQSPERILMRRQIAKLLETAIARLPDTFRPVFVLREVEGLSVEDTAEALQIPEETVKTRLFRARRRLQKELDPELCGALSETFPFAGADCEAMTEKVLASLLEARKVSELNYAVADAEDPTNPAGPH